MKEITMLNHSKPLDRKSKAAMVQVGWLGQSGKVYGLGTKLTEIHENEPASYCPLYMQLGEWKWQPHAMKWYVEQD